MHAQVPLIGPWNAKFKIDTLAMVEAIRDPQQSKERPSNVLLGYFRRQQGALTAWKPKNFAKFKCALQGGLSGPEIMRKIVISAAYIQCVAHLSAPKFQIVLRMTHIF